MFIPNTPLGPFHVFDQGTITRALLDGQWWDDHLKSILDEADPDGAAIDIGAHFGWFTMYLGQRHPLVIAVEPNPDAFALLQRNLKMRIFRPRIQTWPVAAYSHVGRLRFDDESDKTDAGAFAFTQRDGGGYAVAALPLDKYILPTELVSVIKCDAQGADLPALQGLRQTILRCKPLIVFEWEEGLARWQGDAWADYLQFFAQVNYSVDRITTDYWDYVARPKG